MNRMIAEAMAKAAPRMARRMAAPSAGAMPPAMGPAMGRKAGGTTAKKASGGMTRGYGIAKKIKPTGIMD